MSQKPNSTINDVSVLLDLSQQINIPNMIRNYSTPEIFRSALKIVLVLGAVLLFLSVLASCNKDETPIDDNTTVSTLDDLKASETFDWATGHEVTVTLRALNNQDAPLAGVRFDIYKSITQDESGAISGDLIMSGMTGNDGFLNTKLTLADALEKVYVVTAYLGLPDQTEVEIVNRSITATIGGKYKPSTEKSALTGSALSGYSYLGTFTNSGVPNYLVGIDVIDPAFMADVNATFPERQPVPQYHPQYLAGSNETNCVLDEAAEVWVTFVHEGAGWTNTLGYYTYPKGQRPASAAAIQDIKIVYPNVSFNGSGGGLSTGMKVKIGEFPANTEIAWVLIANGWSNGSVGNGTHKVYSDNDFNPEASANLKQHFVLLHDLGRDIVLIGIEDMRRDSGSDNDFNDAMFYVTSNPIVAINTTNMPSVTYTSTDSDGDGVPNNFDDYPNDPQRAFNIYYPSQNGMATLAFEDLWPGKGDYDFNDMVMGYRIKQVANASNKVLDMNFHLKMTAKGASYNNGFGFELPITPAQVASVTGSQITGSAVTLNANGTEAGQTKAVLIAFDESAKYMPSHGGGTGANTTPGAPYVTPVEMDLAVVFTSPIATSTLGSAPFNPFIFVNQNRGREVHLADKTPTSLADETLFGTAHDKTNPALGKYYKTYNNLPWAINIIEEFQYPIEKTPVNDAYLKFIPWAQSSGASYYDWYKDLSGYRNTSYIYSNQ